MGSKGVKPKFKNKLLRFLGAECKLTVVSGSRDNFGFCAR